MVNDFEYFNTEFQNKCNELISEQNLLGVINMTGNTAHFSHAFFMKFFSDFQWTNISSDDIIVDVVQPECSAKHRTALTINLL